MSHSTSRKPEVMGVLVDAPQDRVTVDALTKRPWLSELINPDSRPQKAIDRIILSRSRKQIAELTGLSPATITHVVQALLEDGFVTETCKIYTRGLGKGGAPQTGLDITSDFWEAHSASLQDTKVKMEPLGVALLDKAIKSKAALSRRIPIEGVQRLPQEYTVDLRTGQYDLGYSKMERIHAMQERIALEASYLGQVALLDRSYSIDDETGVFAGASGWQLLIAAEVRSPFGLNLGVDTDGL